MKQTNILRTMAGPVLAVMLSACIAVFPVSRPSSSSPTRPSSPPSSQGASSSSSQSGSQSGSQSTSPDSSQDSSSAFSGSSSSASSGSNASSSSVAPLTDQQREAMRQGVLQRLNASRAKEELPALTMDDAALTAAAQKRAEELAAQATLSHKRPNGKNFHSVFKEVGIRPKNMAETTTKAETEAEWDTQMQDEVLQGHIANELFQKVGIGCVRSTSGTYWAILFVGY